jgi:hypothetical protein
MLTNIKNSILTAGTFSLLSLAISNPSYGLALDLNAFNSIGDVTIDSSTQATINSGTENTVTTGGGLGSLEEFLSIDPIDLQTAILDNAFGSAIRFNSPLIFNTGDTLTFNFNFTTSDNDVAFVTLGTTITTLTSGSPFSFTFASTGSTNFGIGVVDVGDTTGASTLVVRDINLTPVPFEFSPAMGLLAVGTWFGRKKVVAVIKGLRSKG